MFHNKFWDVPNIYFFLILLSVFFLNTKWNREMKNLSFDILSEFFSQIFAFPSLNCFPFNGKRKRICSDLKFTQIFLPHFAHISIFCVFPLFVSNPNMLFRENENESWISFSSFTLSLFRGYIWEWIGLVRVLNIVIVKWRTELSSFLEKFYWSQNLA